MDKTFWQAIVDADYAAPDGHTPQDLIPELLSLLGSTDPLLRDTYGYPILDAWVHRGWYSSADMRGLMARLAENLMSGIGENGADSVFLRSFSVLMLAELVHEDNLRPWLEEAEVRQLLELALVYLEAERDVRGWVQDKGWAHSPAHTADLLFVLARNRFLAADDLQRVLLSVRSKVLDPAALPFVCDEDERLAQPVVAVMRRQLLDAEFLNGWLEGLTHPPDQRAWDDAFLAGERHIPRHNAKTFLRSLYGQLAFTSSLPPGAVEFLSRLTDALMSFSVWYLHVE